MGAGDAEEELAEFVWGTGGASGGALCNGLLGGPAVFDRGFEEGGKFVCRGELRAAGAKAALCEEARPFVEGVGEEAAGSVAALWAGERCRGGFASVSWGWGGAVGGCQVS